MHSQIFAISYLFEFQTEHTIIPYREFPSSPLKTTSETYPISETFRPIRSTRTRFCVSANSGYFSRAKCGSSDEKLIPFKLQCHRNNKSGANNASFDAEALISFIVKSLYSFPFSRRTTARRKMTDGGGDRTELSYSCRSQQLASREMGSTVSVGSSDSS